MFKNSLNHHQRLEVCNLKVMSLRRNWILKNARGKIEVENLNFDALHAKNSQNNLSTLKNYFVVNKILKNWEITKKFANTGSINTQHRSPAKYGRNNSMKMSDVNMKKYTPELNPNSSSHNLTISKDDINRSDIKDKETRDEKALAAKKNRVNDLVRKDEFDFDKFKSIIHDYCKTNCPNKEALLDDNILLFLSQKLAKDELHTLVENPEFIFEIMEDYKNLDESISQEDEEDNEGSDKNEGITYSCLLSFLF